MDNIYEKKYKEALERMKSWAKGEHPECFGEAQKAAEFVFPELKESEGEVIRKELISFLEHCQDPKLVDNRNRDKWIAWLDKQKEWGEEDEKIRQNCIHFLNLQKSHHASTFEIDECIDWLESHKITKLSKDNVKRYKCDMCGINVTVAEEGYTWSEEDEEMIKQLLYNQEILFDTAGNDALRGKYSKEIEWLNSLKYKCSPQLSAQWKPTQI